MKPVLLLALVVNTLTSIASDSIPARKIKYRINLITRNEESVKGYLSHFSDSTVYILPILNRNMEMRFQNRVSFPEISQITFKRKGSTGKGLLYGALGGALTGALIGLAHYEEPDCPPGTWFCIDFGPGMDALGGGIIGSVGGGLIGALIGSAVKKTFIIGGRKDNFEKLKMNVLQRAYSR